MPATRIGPFALVERLGEGGMGDVWLARPLGVPGAPPLCVLKVARSIVDPAEHDQALPPESDQSL